VSARCVFSRARDVPSVACSSEPSRPRVVLLSVNRFERKKGLRLAIEAFAKLKTAGSNAVLVMAGGYDPRLAENVEHAAELTALCGELGLRSAEHDRSKRMAVPEEGVDVLFVKSFSDEDKTVLLRLCSAVVYTPVGEHFGIVPLEAMAAWRPVLAVNQAGPTETVLHGETGFLEPPTADAFAGKLRMLVNNPSLVDKLGRAARHHVVETFSRTALQREWNRHCTELQGRPPIRWLPAWLLWLSFAALVVELWLVGEYYLFHQSV
jgi:alpha-1,3/alpha-1,6-mannosyltransferase